MSTVAHSGTYDGPPLVVGVWRGRYLRFTGQQFVLLAAPARSGKGVGIVVPNLLSYPDSVVVLDIKQENFNLTAGFRRAHGHDVYLMPTTGPYLLRDVFPELAGPGCLPSSPSIWEMSRFAGSGLPDHRTGSTSGMSLFPYAMALALSFGATRVIGVVSRSIARLYRRFGLDLHDIRADTSPGLADIVACAIDLDSTTFQKLRCDPDALLGSISFFGHPCPSQHGSPVRLHAPGAYLSSSEAGDDAPFSAYGNGTVRTQPAI